MAIRPDGTYLFAGLLPAYKFPNENTILTFLVTHQDTSKIYDIDPDLIHRVAKSLRSCASLPAKSVHEVAWRLVLHGKGSQAFLEPEFKPVVFDKVTETVATVLRECAKAYAFGELKETDVAPRKSLKTATIQESSSLAASLFCCCFSSPNNNYLNTSDRDPKWYLFADDKSAAARWKALDELYNPVVTQPKTTIEKITDYFSWCLPSLTAKEEAKALIA